MEKKQVSLSGAADRNTIPVEIIYVDPRFNSDKPEHDKFAKLAYGSVGAAAVDLFACIDEPMIIRPGDRVTISTGINIWLNDVNAGAFMLPRSGIGSNEGIVLANLVGLIDSDFQGTMQIPLWNTNPQVVWDEEFKGVRYNKEHEFTVHPGDRICQMTLLTVLHGEYSEVTQFSGKTERGEGGLGSTKGIGDEAIPIYGVTMQLLDVFHYAPSPAGNGIRLHTTVADSPVWVDVSADEDTLSELTYPCLATFAHHVNGASTVTVEQNGESFEFLINQSADKYQFIKTDDTSVFYRVAGSNMMCSLRKSYIKDFATPSDSEKSTFTIINGANDALVRFEYCKKN